jgi:predicted house-cleaning NTP pyrophosphatase (Maf/HAM1 superfamily)
MHIILGSQSQGRRELLSAMGYAFAVMPAQVVFQIWTFSGMCAMLMPYS